MKFYQGLSTARCRRIFRTDLMGRSAIRNLVLWLGLMLSVQSVSATEFVSEIMISYSGTSSDNARKNLADSGYVHIVEHDWNSGDKQRIFIGYKTSTNPADAIVDLMFFVSDKNGYHPDYVRWGLTYTCVTTCRKTNDLRYGNGGKYVYLMYTKRAIPIRILS